MYKLVWVPLHRRSLFIRVVGMIHWHVWLVGYWHRVRHHRSLRLVHGGLVPHAHPSVEPQHRWSWLPCKLLIMDECAVLSLHTPLRTTIRQHIPVVVLAVHGFVVPAHKVSGVVARHPSAVHRPRLHHVPCTWGLIWSRRWVWLTCTLACVVVWVVLLVLVVAEGWLLALRWRWRVSYSLLHGVVVGLLVVGLGKLSGAGFRIAILHIHIINMRVFFQVSQLPRLLIWFQDGLHLLAGKGAFFGVDFLQDQDKVGVNGFGLRLRLHCMHF